MYLELLFNLCSRARESKPVMENQFSLSLFFLPPATDGGLKIGDLCGDRDAGGLETRSESEYNFRGARISRVAERYARPISTRDRDNENARSPLGRSAVSQRDAANANAHPTTLSRSVTALCTYIMRSRFVEQKAD